MALKKQVLKGKPECKVTFMVPADRLPEKAKVYLVTDFNNWDEGAYLLKKNKNGNYSISINLPIHAEYQFRYLVNGHLWINDEAADKYVHNNIDDYNSVVVIE